MTQIRKFAGHPEYDLVTYRAIGSHYTAEGWTGPRYLFSFRGPGPESTDQRGLVALASALRIRNGYPTFGDESVEYVKIA